MTIDDIIQRIQTFAVHKGWTKAVYAREAGLPRTTLRLFGQKEWNPTVDTLRKLEAVIPADFQLPFPAHDPAVYDGGVAQ